MHRAIVSSRIGGFASEKDRVLQWSRNGVLCAVRSHFSVTVRSQRKRIALPIMKIGTFEKALQLAHTRPKQVTQSLQRVLGHEFFALPREALRRTKRSPCRNDRAL